MILPIFTSSIALPQTFISGCRRLCTRSQWCACSRAVWSWGPSTAGSLTSSRPPAPGSIDTCAPPAGGCATRHHWEPTWQEAERDRGRQWCGKWVNAQPIKWINKVVMDGCVTSHLGPDAHWPWHAGIWMTALQLSTVTLRLVSLTTQPLLPGFREKMVTSNVTVSLQKKTFWLIHGFNLTHRWSSSADCPTICPPGEEKSLKK